MKVNVLTELHLTQNNDVFVEVSGLLKALAVNLMKIANDFRIQNIIAKFYLSISQWGQVNKVGRKEVELYI